MTATAHNVVSLFRARRNVRDWDNSELAQFYRVEAALRQAGIFIDTDRGLTDEGDPWFVYCRQDSGEVFLHIARIDGLYLVASPSMPKPIWRRSFTEILDELSRENPVLLPQPARRSSPELFIHPSTILIAAVAALFFKSSPVRADEQADNQLRQSEGRAAQGHGTLSEVYSAALISAIAIIAVLHHTHSDAPLVEDQQVEELAFLDGILFQSGATQDVSRAFQGDTGSSQPVDAGLDAQIELAVSDKVVDGHSGALTEASAFLKDVFGKFVTIVAAADAQSLRAEVPAAKQVRDATADHAAAAGGQEFAGESATSSPLLAASLKHAADSGAPVQQVTLVAELDDGALMPAGPVTAAASKFPEPVEKTAASGDPDTAVDEPPAVLPAVVEEPVDPRAAYGGFDHTTAFGLMVLLTPTDDPVVTPAVEPPHADPALADVALAGISTVVDPGLLTVA